jgi:hypothetical protein
MSIEAKRVYIKALQEGYKNSTRAVKTVILNAFVSVVGCSRKHAIRAINGSVNLPGKFKAGRKPQYRDPEFVIHLKAIWQAMGEPCSKKLVAAMPEWLPHYRELPTDSPTRELLLRVSSASVDRILKPFRDRGARGKSTTQASFIKNRIPIALLTEQVQTPGFLEGDTVVHCGNSIHGTYLNSLTMTDLYSGWTENRASWTKTAEQVLEQIRDIERSLPFAIKGFASDSGSEFINEELWSFFTAHREKPIEFVRRRPYKKNDNAHVEQKNWTHVRQIFGYERFDQQFLQGLMNEIYKYYWNPIQNYFMPCLKLKEKTRIGGKLVKKYEVLKTPYQRIIEFPDTPEEVKKQLRSRYQGLNPFLLKNELEKKLAIFFKLLRSHGTKVA